MISGLCGFAERIRHHGGDVGAAELIDAARAFTFIDLADRKAIEGALRLTISWASLQPKAFQELFDSWFAADGFEVAVAEDEFPEALLGVALDAETIDAARIHTDDALAVEDRPDGVDGATTDDGVVPNPAVRPVMIRERRQRAMKVTSPRYRLTIWERRVVNVTTLWSRFRPLRLDRT